MLAPLASLSTSINHMMLVSVRHAYKQLQSMILLHGRIYVATQHPALSDASSYQACNAVRSAP